MAAQHTPNLSQIKQVVDNKSGYPFELGIVCRIERDEDYTYIVEPNYSYEDQDSGEARELDFHAIQAVPLSTKRSEYIFLVILGCCKNNNNPYLFFTRDMPFGGITLDLNTPVAGYPLEIFVNNEESEDIQWYFRFHELLHVFKTDTISSQCCEVVKVSKGWKVQSGSLFNDTIIPLVKVLFKEIGEYNEKNKPSADETEPNYQIFYPLVVLNGPMLEYHYNPDGSSELRETKHILFVKHYESKTVKGRFAIDIIHQSYLKQYLALINEENNKFVNLIRRHRRVLVKSIKKLSSPKKDDGTNIE